MERCAFGISRLRVAACDVEWELDARSLGELRRHVLFTLLRRAQLAPHTGTPDVFDAPAGDRPPWRGAREGELLQIRGGLRVSPSETLVLGYDPSAPDHVTFELTAARRNPGYSDCEVALEVGPAMLEARRTAVAPDLQSVTHELHRVDDFLFLGLVDNAWIQVCGRRVDVGEYLAGLRRFVLLTLLARAETSQHGFAVDLPPAPERERGPGALPSERTTRDHAQPFREPGSAGAGAL